MNPISVHVNLGPRSHDIFVTHGDLPAIGSFARQRCGGNRALIVTDEHVQAHARIVAKALADAGFEVAEAVRPAGEEQKSLRSAAELYDRLVDMSADRATLIVAVGGGVVGDLAGFVAATYARGLPHLMVPTTLLAMVDSSIGGKVAVNHPRAKNMIGAVHQPIGVWTDCALLASLPEGDFRSGLAEVVKYGVILDAELFAYLETQSQAILERQPDAIRHIVARCARLKVDVVEADEFELTGRRAILNYGHTFGHAFEVLAKFSDLMHGEAVSMGMVCASKLAELRGLIPPEATNRQIALLRTFGLPIAAKPWPVADVLACMRSDKKTLAGRLRFILPRRIGEAALFDDVPEADVERVLNLCPFRGDLAQFTTQQARHSIPIVVPRLQWQIRHSLSSRLFARRSRSRAVPRPAHPGNGGSPGRWDQWLSNQSPPHPAPHCRK